MVDRTAVTAACRTRHRDLVSAKRRKWRCPGHGRDDPESQHIARSGGLHRRLHPEAHIRAKRRTRDDRRSAPTTYDSHKRSHMSSRSCLIPQAHTPSIPVKVLKQPGRPPNNRFHTANHTGVSFPRFTSPNEKLIKMETACQETLLFEEPSHFAKSVKSCQPNISYGFNLLKGGCPFQTHRLRSRPVPTT